MCRLFWFGVVVFVFVVFGGFVVQVLVVVLVLGEDMWLYVFFDKEFVEEFCNCL